MVQEIGMITVGMDIGSLTVKVAVLADGKVLAHRLVLAGDNSREAATKATEETMSLAGVDAKDVAGFVSTGLGRSDAPYAAEEATEVLCDVKGALFHYPSARTVIDMGAESIRVARCGANGRVLDYAQNDKCASGTGIFLDTIATALEVEVADLGPLSLEATESITMTATCAVFAESEVVGLIAQGVDKASILGGIHASVASRTYGLVNRVGINEDVILIGGVARNIGVTRGLEAAINHGLLVAQDPQIVGAIGAAIIARDRSK